MAKKKVVGLLEGVIQQYMKLYNVTRREAVDMIIDTLKSIM